VRPAVGALSAVAVVAALAFLAQGLLGSWADLSQRLVAVQPAPFALGVALIMLQTLLVAAIWREVLGMIGTHVGLAQAYHMIYVAALGKYLPGKVWTLGGIAVLAARLGVPLPAAALASTATVALVGAGGALVGGLAYLLWRLAVAPSVTFAAVGLLALTPWLAARALPSGQRDPAADATAAPPVAIPAGRGQSRAEEHRQRPLSLWEQGCPMARQGPGRARVRASRWWRGLHPDSTPGRAGPALRALAAANASWLLLALANWSIARAIEPVGLDLAPALLASAALGWAAGLAAVAVPAGLGVREAVQALALTDVLPPSTAAAFALLVRLALILGDLLAAALAWALRPAPGPVESRAPLPHH
jgi:hypothetical protein